MILDYRMPDRDGLFVGRDIRAFLPRVVCASNVPKRDVFKPLRLASSEKQITQIVENIGK